LMGAVPAARHVMIVVVVTGPARGGDYLERARHLTRSEKGLDLRNAGWGSLSGYGSEWLGCSGDWAFRKNGGFLRRKLLFLVFLLFHLFFHEVSVNMGSDACQSFFFFLALLFSFVLSFAMLIDMDFSGAFFPSFLCGTGETKCQKRKESFFSFYYGSFQRILLCHLRNAFFGRVVSHWRGFFFFHRILVGCLWFIFRFHFFRTGGWGLEICFEHVYIGFFFSHFLFWSIKPSHSSLLGGVGEVCRLWSRCTLVSPRWANIPWTDRSLVCEFETKQGIQWIIEERKSEEKISYDNLDFILFLLFSLLELVTWRNVG